MKATQFKEKVRQGTAQELEHLLQEERKSLFMLRRDSATKKVENPSKLVDARRNIARILTEMRERELKAQKGTS